MKTASLTFLKKHRPGVLHKYLLKQFIVTFAICLLIATALFVVFDFFEKVRVFLREETAAADAFQYILYKIPFVIQRMSPVAALIATMLTIGKLSQNSEVTAMRACGASLLWLTTPLLGVGLILSGLMFVWGETVVPFTMRRVDEIYNFDIKKKVERGSLSRSHFWHRSKNLFFNVGHYDSRSNTLSDFSYYQMGPNFELNKRVDSKSVNWHPKVGWTMNSVVETTYAADKKVVVTPFDKLPLPISERPNDFYNIRTNPEALSFKELSKYIRKLRSDGVPVTVHLVDLNSKISMALVNFICILIAIPFALIPARSGTMTASFVAGVSIGFGYHFVHAFATSFGAAELLPVIPSAWAANIVLGCIGGYLMAGAETK